jgi:branched-chain amino acid transport system permease protein
MGQSLINAVTLGSIYLLFALGMSLAWGTIGILNFAHGAIFMFSAFSSFLLVRIAPLPMPVMILVGLVVGGVLSVLAQALAFEPIQRRNPDHRRAEMQLIVGGIGIAGIPLAIAQQLTKNTPFGFSNSPFAVESYQLGPVHLTNVQIVILVAAALLTSALAWWLHAARAGLALRAIGVDAEVTGMMGVNRRKLALGTMAVAGALAGIAGVLLTYYLGSLSAASGESFLIKAFAAIILGGVGSIGGTVAGAMILALAETLVLTQTSGLWVDAVSFGLIFLILIFRPRGLLGRKEVRRT